MRVVAVESSTPKVSVAAVDSITGLTRTILVDPSRRLSRTLLAAMAELAAAGWSLDSVDILAADVGPGSFTGLRVGLAAVKGIAYASCKPAVGVSSLDVIASQAPAAARVAAFLDARGGQYYAALYDTRVYPPAPLAPITVVNDPAGVAWDVDVRCGPLPPGGAREEWIEIAPEATALASLAAYVYERAGATSLTALRPLYIKRGQV